KHLKVSEGFFHYPNNIFMDPVADVSILEPSASSEQTGAPCPKGLPPSARGHLVQSRRSFSAIPAVSVGGGSFSIPSPAFLPRFVTTLRLKLRLVTLCDGFCDGSDLNNPQCLCGCDGCDGSGPLWTLGLDIQTPENLPLPCAGLPAPLSPSPNSQVPR